MTLSAPMRLGPYEILAPLGAGGMGEVYRARDTRLDRTVAIKILPQHLSADPVRKQRFEREAKAISSLNHPHICILHDIGQQDGIDFLVMECIEGETLAKRLEKGPLPLEQVLKYGAQIANALDKAHRCGIVHRDLKPSNIMLTPTGAKLLDFGLARPAVSLANATTLAAASPASSITVEGTILGTFQYMSPEQVDGRDLDGRSDIFSLGAVLYEIVTGKKAFDGKSQLSVASAILEREPEAITTAKPLTPPALDHAIRRCLAKDREERWQTARDLEFELTWIAENGRLRTSSLGAPAGAKLASTARALLWSSVTLLLAGVVGVASWLMKPGPQRSVSHAVITLPRGQRLAGLDEAAIALSDDGTQLAYVALQGNTQQIYLRSMDNPQPRAITGTEGGTSPFFSPDGQWLGFFADQKLKKVSLSGGGVVTLGDATNPHGGSWSPQGTIVFGSLPVGPLQQTPDTATALRPLTSLEKGEVSHRSLQFLPGGKSLLYIAGTSSFNWSSEALIVAQEGTSGRRNLISGAVSPRYASSGHLLYAQEGNILAAPFDAQRLAVTGPAAAMVEGILQSRITGAAQYAVSSTGSLVFISGGMQTDHRKLVWVDRNGKEQAVGAPVRAYLFPRISPDGKHVAMGITEETTQIWAYDFIRETLTRITFEGNQSLNAVWSPDGKTITFRSHREASDGIYSEPADGSGELQKLVVSDRAKIPMSWSPDGQTLAFMEISSTTGFDLWVLTLNDHKPKVFLQTPFNESAPRFSPDGHWLAYVSNESGRYEIYVQTYPGPGGKQQISTDGGTEPVWNPNGRELFYRVGNKLMVVDVVSQTSFSASKPQILFEGRFLPTPATSPNYDVSRDGQRFLMVKAAEPEEQSATQINVVFNWFEELKRRVPSGKN
jgi:eukaryotic-like serine/threonine-protein kinase